MGLAHFSLPCLGEGSTVFCSLVKDEGHAGNTKEGLCGRSGGQTWGSKARGQGSACSWLSVPGVNGS